MLTSSGIGMAVGICWCIIGMIILIFLCRSKKERTYRIIGAFICIFMGLSFILDNRSIALITVTVALGQTLGLVIQTVTKSDE